MILTCPACATRYFVDDGAIPVAGRAVRCSACRRVWRAEGQPAPTAAPSPEAVTPSVEMHDPLPELFSLRPAPPPRRRRSVLKPVLAAVGVVVVLAGVTALFRTEIERAWPASAGAYAAVLGK
jgi:predicted Zn finger-like uncharacterized protein